MYRDTMVDGLSKHASHALVECDELYHHWVAHFMFAFGEVERRVELSNAVLRRCLQLMNSSFCAMKEKRVAQKIWQDHLPKIHKAHWDEERWILQYQLSIAASQLWPATFPMTQSQYQLDEMAKYAFEPNVRVYETILDTISASKNSELPVQARVMATLRLMKDMQTISHPLTPSICAGLVQACTPHTSEKFLHPYMPFILDHLRSIEIIPDSKLMVSLIECFAKAGQSTSIRRLLQQYPQSWRDPAVGAALLRAIPHALKDSEYRQLIYLAKDAPQLRSTIQSQLSYRANKRSSLLQASSSHQQHLHQ